MDGNMSKSALPEGLKFFDDSLETLKEKFSLDEISDKIASVVPVDCGFKGISSWDEFESIRKMLLFLAIYKERTDEDYFISPQTELLYKLVELEGVAQQNALRITVSLYKSKTQAKIWWRKLSLVVHPDRCNHRSATRATEELNRLYEEMLKNGR